MFPIRDHNPSRRIPYVTYTLIALNVLIFISYQGLDGRQLGAFYAMWGMIPANITAGNNYYSLVSSVFLHGGWMHLLGNMLYLWVFGDNIEDSFGHGPFIVFYMACGILASATQILWDPTSPIPNIGASGAIAGVLGGYLLLFPRARVDVFFFFIIIIRIIPIPAFIVLAVWFGLQIFNGLAVDTSGGGVAYWAHAGGFAAGTLLCIPLWLRLGGIRFWAHTHGHPPHPETQYSGTRIPRVPKR